MNQVVAKKIKNIKVIKPGSPPDVDSDFATYCRDDVLSYVENVYGRGTLSNIITFSSLAAKGAFKTMCTIYQIPFAEANKIAALVPSPIEGVECTLKDIFNPNSSRYSEGADFRAATSEPKWKEIIEGAIAIEGRMKSTGVHPCGVIISSRPLDETIPLQIRQDDNRVIAQWNYPELEALGLIKFDFLGLDTVDLIQHTVEYIGKNGKPQPSMAKLIHGPMDDPKTYEMIAKGHTHGIFQLGGEGVQSLLKRMSPTSLDDIAATTALYRPGPMGMNSHIKYADRKTGREKIDYPIHPEFKNSELEDILKKTYGLCVYQEQIIQIANRIAGMTLQEGDDLRSAMGKKKMAKMMSMRPKFIEGGQAKGFSKEAMTVLWDTCAEFAKYGFNLAHSVAYAINAYQAAYLKANYPVEFIAALIAQNVDNKDKTLLFLQEAKRMKLEVGPPDINAADVNVAPDYAGNSEYDILFGLSGVNSVSKETAAAIIKARESGGKFISIQDVINRCSAEGVANKKVFENLAYAGAFDSFGVSRRSIVENIGSLLGNAKTQQNKGKSLFDMLGGDDTVESVDFASVSEYPHLEKLKLEAHVVGLYLTSHPLAHAGSLAGLRSSSIEKLLKSKERTDGRIVGSLTSVVVKRSKRGGKSIAITLDDGTGYITAFMNKHLVKGIDKTVAQEKIKELYVNGATAVPEEIEASIMLNEFPAMEELEIGSVYSMEVAFKPGFDDNPYSARVSGLHRVDLADDGKLPIRIRLPKPESQAQKAKQAKVIKEAAHKFAGDFPIYVSYTPASIDSLIAAREGTQFLDAIDAIKAGEPVLEMENEAAKKKRNRDVKSSKTLMGGQSTEKTEEPEVVRYRNWPPPVQQRGPVKKRRAVVANANTIDTVMRALESLEYRKTRFTAEKSQALSMYLEGELGIENYDFGILNADILIED